MKTAQNPQADFELRVLENREELTISSQVPVRCEYTGTLRAKTSLLFSPGS
ncbi:hypothetical protein HRQ91_03865 [Treponema parvum]|uniref:Uncharacterized protein n=1 Tax=Treponema parvum TaxID=138851 RepID=A0A975IEB6_9SPIR|nr:hypothetical protein [Treponema parvum]QTQ13662.1 hypothetical protein HRQ91_03865 [Treponema parvum]